MDSDPDMHVMAVEAAVLAQDSEILNKYLPLAEKTVARINHPLYQAIVSRARGVSHRQAGENDDAAIHLAGALDDFRILDTPWQIGTHFAGARRGRAPSEETTTPLEEIILKRWQRSKALAQRPMQTEPDMRSKHSLSLSGSTIGQPLEGSLAAV